jgi:Fe-S-cluster containining protein
VSRCTGHCCRVFSLPNSPKEVASKEFREGVVDGEIISDMVIPLDYEPLEDDGKPYRWFYTCKHFDGENCTNYEGRPMMCRTYPDGGKCVQLGCTMCQKGKEHLEDSVTAPEEIQLEEGKKYG